MLEIDFDDRKEQRKFGISTGVFLGVIGLLRYWWHDFEQVPYIFWSIAAVFAVLGLVAPPVLKPALRVAAFLAEKMNWVMMHVVLTLAFYLIMTPSGIIYRLVSGDPLKRKWDPDASTYWDDADPTPKGTEAYKNQF